MSKPSTAAHVISPAPRSNAMDVLVQVLFKQGGNWPRPQAEKDSSLTQVRARKLHPTRSCSRPASSRRRLSNLKPPNYGTPRVQLQRGEPIQTNSAHGPSDTVYLEPSLPGAPGSCPWPEEQAKGRASNASFNSDAHHRTNTTEWTAWPVRTLSPSRALPWVIPSRWALRQSAASA
jgi:hypothetical protein